MYAFLVIGMTGQGKSPFIHSYIDGRNAFVFDVQNEYGQRTKYPGQTPIGLSDNWQDARSRHIELDEKKFIFQCSQKKNTVCVFEEATAFFEGRTDKEMRRLIISKIHTGNVYMFVFHSISSVPPRIMQLCNYVVLFKTNDEANIVEAKYSRLLPYFLDLQKKPKGSKHIIQLIEQ